MIIGLAPMDGITDIAYRQIVSDIFLRYTTDPTHQLWTRTEFMNADGYMLTPHKLVKHLLYPHPHHVPLIAQIYGGNADALIQTAIDIQKKYSDFDGIELNIGCPSPKVMACGGGSGMLCHRPQTLQIIRELSQATDLPFSIKTRAGITTDDKQEQYDFILAAAPYCDTITIHGRTIKQSHAGDVDRQFIYDIKRELVSTGSRCRIIGNGGITSYADGMSKCNNLDGRMVGQAAIADPRVLTPYTPSISDRYETIMSHLHLSLATQLYRLQHSTPDYSDDAIVYNRSLMHQIKKAHIDDDTLSQIQGKLLPHTYQFPQPPLHDRQTLGHDLATQGASHPLLQQPLHALVEFRKYLFGYVAGIPGSKQFKQQVATINTYTQLIECINSFFAQQ